MTPAIIVAILLFFGIFMALIPALPWSLYMFGVVTIYAVVDKFETIHPWHLALFGAFIVLGYVVDYSSGLIGARLGGASRTSLIGGLIGLVIGLLLFPPLGAFAGLFFGIFLAELMTINDHIKALKAASFSVIGMLAGIAINVCLAITFFIIFLIVAL